MELNLQLDLVKKTTADCAIILEALQRGERLTSGEVYRLYGVMNLSTRISDLRRGLFDGMHWNIKKERHGNWMVYYL